MPIAVMEYSTGNLGDDIQAYALEQLLPQVDLRVDRDDLSPAAAWGPEVQWIISGWYAPGSHRVWPPPGLSQKLYLGFHATEPEILPPHVSTIGCRDPWTLIHAVRRGLDGWLSYCPTLTLPPAINPRREEILLVDVPDTDLKRLPADVAQGRRLTHTMHRPEERRARAEHYVNLYRHAKWVVTTRLHVLLPCVAMGTPVVFIKPPHSENRYSGYTPLAWTIANAPWSAPRPRWESDVVASLMVPLRDALRRFLEP